jgi:uncharacterized membrane protein
MWLYLIAFTLILIGIVGGLFAGGIFTIVLLPLALILVLVAVLSAAAGRKTPERDAIGETHDPAPLPSQPERPSGRVPTSPERLADARRAEQ